MRVPIPIRGDRTEGPWWKPVTDGDKRSATICCPDCNKVAYLDHQIADNGDVYPSVVCPTPGCNWHVYVTLVGWSSSS